MHDLSLERAEYDAILRGHPWIRSVDPYASLSRGWSPILVDLLRTLDAVMGEITETDADAHATLFSTKSKFGSLRVHFALVGLSGTPEAAWHRIRPPTDEAEARSARSCERCGAPGRTRDADGWIVTLCDAHAVPAT